MALACLQIQRVPRGEQRVVAPVVALRRADVADAAVLVLVVVPMHEARGPGPRIVQIGKAVLRELGPYFPQVAERI